MQKHKRSSFHVFCTFLSLAYTLFDTSLAFEKPPLINCKATRTFIKTECHTTYFANLCYIFLSPYACTIRINRRELSEAAIDATSTTTNNVLKLLVKLSKQGGIKANVTEAATISGCVDDIVDGIDDINIASRAMNNRLVNETIREANKQQAVAYIGYAMADDKRCLKRLSNGGIRDSLKIKISAAISNALKLKTISITLVGRI